MQQEHLSLCTASAGDGTHTVSCHLYREHTNNCNGVKGCTLLPTVDLQGSRTTQSKQLIGTNRLSNTVAPRDQVYTETMLKAPVYIIELCRSTVHSTTEEQSQIIIPQSQGLFYLWLITVLLVLGHWFLTHRAILPTSMARVFQGMSPPAVFKWMICGWFVAGFVSLT